MRCVSTQGDTAHGNRGKYPVPFSTLHLAAVLGFSMIVEIVIGPSRLVQSSLFETLEIQILETKETPQLKQFLKILPTIHKLSSFSLCICSDMICHSFVLVYQYLCSLLVTKQTSAITLTWISCFTAGTLLVNSLLNSWNNSIAELTELFPVKFQMCPTQPLPPAWAASRLIFYYCL